MKMFIGHYYEEPERWFLAWGENKEDAAMYVDGIEGEPDLRSMKEITEMGMMNLNPLKCEEEDFDPTKPEEMAEEGLEPHYYILGPTGPVDGNNYLDSDDWFCGLGDHVKKCIEEPLPPEDQAQSMMDIQLGIHQPELSDSYSHVGDEFCAQAIEMISKGKEKDLLWLTQSVYDLITKATSRQIPTLLQFREFDLASLLLLKDVRLNATLMPQFATATEDVIDYVMDSNESLIDEAVERSDVDLTSLMRDMVAKGQESKDKSPSDKKR